MINYKELRQKASATVVLNHYGYYQTTNNSNFTCPFHPDKHPSLEIISFNGEERCRCWVCNYNVRLHEMAWMLEKNDKDAFLELRSPKTNNNINDKDVPLPYQQAHKLLNDICNLGYAEEDIYNINKKMPDSFSVSEVEIFNQAKNIAQQNLHNKDFDKQVMTDPIEYLKKRKISDRVIRQLEIGFNPKGVVYRELRNYGFNDEILYNAGIIDKSKNKENSYYDFQMNRLLFPIKNNQGQTVAFAGRSLKADEKVKYKFNKVSDVFKKNELLYNYWQAKNYVAKENEIIIFEGTFDVASALEMGLNNSVALLGATLSDHNIEELKKQKKSNYFEVSLCLDNDNAGHENMQKIIPKLLLNGFDVSVLNIEALNKGKDLNDLLCNNVTKEELLNTKISGINYILSSLFKTKKKVKVNEIKKIYNGFLQVFQAEKNKIVSFIDDEEKFSEINNNYNSLIEILKIEFVDYIEENFNYNKNEVKTIIGEMASSQLKTQSDSFLYSYVSNSAFNKIIREHLKNKIDKILIEKTKQDKNNNNEMEVLKAFIDDGYIDDVNFVDDCMNCPEKFIQVRDTYGDIINLNKDFDIKENENFKICINTNAFFEIVKNSLQFQNFSKKYNQIKKFNLLLQNISLYDNKTGETVDLTLSGKQKELILDCLKNDLEKETFDKLLLEIINGQKFSLSCIMVDEVEDLSEFVSNENNKQIIMSDFKTKRVSMVSVDGETEFLLCLNNKNNYFNLSKSNYVKKNTQTETTQLLINELQTQQITINKLKEENQMLKEIINENEHPKDNKKTGGEE